MIGGRGQGQGLKLYKEHNLPALAGGRAATAAAAAAATAAAPHTLAPTKATTHQMTTGQAMKARPTMPPTADRVAVTAGLTILRPDLLAAMVVLAAMVQRRLRLNGGMWAFWVIFCCFLKGSRRFEEARN